MINKKETFLNNNFEKLKTINIVLIDGMPKIDPATLFPVLEFESEYEYKPGKYNFSHVLGGCTITLTDAYLVGDNVGDRHKYTIESYDFVVDLVDA